MKKLYGIGTGPGDKELLTLKAVKAIESSSVIFAPNNKGKNMAVDTAKDFIGNKKIVFIDFPMGHVLKEDYKKAAETIFKEIPEGEIGSFLTIGDPMVYSTFIYIMEELEGRDIDIEIISGIPSFVAAAGESKTPLTVKGESFLLCDELNEELLEKITSIAILKTFKGKEKILNILDSNDYCYKYIKRATLEEQEIIIDKEEILNDKDYISLIMARKN
ncbi:precorrin-2 C(20)-methyltransferase [Tissierella carlieri]|uniref:Precorrin-2 C(20)-methyltransferase n=1 Tax=Tissierella carlieri TaxID=689904 RepID=A0ABT1S8P3_9FIRM|nr:precorrin-2 C(20)-methyltransferase [Tissierella carlieri]MBU5312434.1 precorrin-2 C(20)-methyltransferase [Tissierella carlieri]MCQ4922841.1 precorrin-2 C(20)-methyltransferase [Tissierella carlieri]